MEKINASFIGKKRARDSLGSSNSNKKKLGVKTLKKADAEKNNNINSKLTVVKQNEINDCVLEYKIEDDSSVYINL
jgi:hypothetical protein